MAPLSPHAVSANGDDLDLPRKERERLARRAEMLAAARYVFAERGFVGATLEEIAQRAEFGKGTLYNYFPGGKDEILFAVFDELFDDLDALVDKAFPGGNSIEWQAHSRAWFSNYITACFEYFESREDLFLILTRESHRMCFSENTDRVAYFRRQRARIAQGLTRQIEQAVAAGAMRPFPPPAVAHMIFGNISGLQLHRALEESGECSMGTDGPRISSSRHAAAFLSSFLFDGLLTDQAPS